MDWLRGPRHAFSVPHEEARTIIPVTFCGRAFTEQEVELMRVVAHDYAGLGVTEIARTVCELKMSLFIICVVLVVNSRDTPLMHPSHGCF